VDLAFHLSPAEPPPPQCRSLLIQLRLSEAPAQARQRRASPGCSAFLNQRHGRFKGEQWRPGHRGRTGTQFAPTRPSRKWPKRLQRDLPANCFDLAGPRVPGR